MQGLDSDRPRLQCHPGQLDHQPSSQGLKKAALEVLPSAAGKWHDSGDA